jgi:thioredoxin-related protein
MRRLAIITMAVAALGLPLMAADNLEGFKKTYADAQKAAQASGKPMYLHFTTTWCGWCRKIEQDVYGSEEGKKALAAFVPASLDCTVEQGKQPTAEAKINLDLMAKYGGEGYPFLVMLSPDGELLHSFSGYMPVKDSVKELDKALKAMTEFKAFKEYAAKADKKGYEYNLKAMKMYSTVRDFVAAAEAAQAIRKLDPKNAKGDGADAALVLFQQAAADKQADPAKTKQLMEEIRKLDPKNEKGALEKAVLAQALASYKASRTRDAELRKAKLKETADAMSELTGSGVKLTEVQEAYSLLGVAQASLGDLDAAGAAFQKGIDADPKSATADRLRTMLQRVQDLKAKQKP